MERIEYEGDGVTIIADAVGQPDAPLVLFLHGGGQTRQSWGKAVKAAAEVGYRGISIDLRGHGDSGWAADEAYGIGDFTGDVRQVIKQLGRPVSIVGASLGGLVGMLIAADRNVPVSSLVLVDVAVSLEPEGTRQIGNFMTSAPNGFASLDEAADAVAAYLPHRSRPKNTMGLMRNLRQRGDGRLHWHWDPAFIKVKPGRVTRDEQLFAQAAKALQMPVLLIRGGQSRVVSREGAAAFQKLVAHAELIDVAGADHMVAGDANDHFNKAVFSFLTRQVPVIAGASSSPISFFRP